MLSWIHYSSLQRSPASVNPSGSRHKFVMHCTMWTHFIVQSVNSLKSPLLSIFTSQDLLSFHLDHLLLLIIADQSLLTIEAVAENENNYHHLKNPTLPNKYLLPSWWIKMCPQDLLQQTKLPICFLWIPNSSDLWEMGSVPPSSIVLTCL